MRSLMLLFAGMLCATSAAHAADHDLSGPISPEQGKSSFSWTGAYIGATYAKNSIVDFDPTFILGPTTFTGGVQKLGVHAGYQIDMGRFSLGAEYEYMPLDMQFVDKGGIGPIPVYVEDAHALRARLGLNVDRVQIYGLAGMTYYKVNVGFADWKPNVGVGFDVAVTDHIILGAQYAHGWYNEFDGQPFEGKFDQYSVRLGYKF
ncbi:MAG: porin family protein [Nitratireductor sp.]|nr:porin family protein [Nitratireductor sp.]MCB1458239.1 porin family protein [Nitratireductor sp.]